MDTATATKTRPAKVGDITLHHPAASHGIPVILDGRRKPFQDQKAAAKLVMQELGWSYRDVEGATGRSRRTIEKYFYGKDSLALPAEVLNVLMLAWHAAIDAGTLKAS